jgi:hypothetical protein
MLRSNRLLYGVAKIGRLKPTPRSTFAWTAPRGHEARGLVPLAQIYDTA